MRTRLRLCAALVADPATEPAERRSGACPPLPTGADVPAADEPILDSGRDNFKLDTIDRQVAA